MVKNANERDLRIARLQYNLAAIRKIAGWTTEHMGDKIGVTKQTISNLENSKTPMNVTQYIAIRAILDCEIETNPENDILSKVVSVLLDSDDDEYEKFKEPVSTVAAAAAGGVASGALLGILSALVPISGIGIAGGIACASWLKKILANK